MTGTLTYGALNIAAAPYRAYVNADFGAPVPLTTALPQMLLDGEVVSGTRSSNREMKFTVEIEANDLTSLATYEANLVAEINNPRNTLTWSPDGVAPATVFETFRGQMVFRYDDALDLNNIRVYEITLPALPFARSVNTVTASALSVGAGADTQINACDATTGWAGTTNVSSLAVDTTQKIEGTGSLKVNSAGSAWQQVEGDTWKVTLDSTVTLTTSALDLSTTPYVRVTAWSAYSSSQTVTLTVDGAAAPLMATRQAAGNWRTYYFYSQDASATSFQFRVQQSWTGYLPGGPNGSGTPPTDWVIRLDDVRRSGALPTTGSGTGRQALRSVSVAGSERTSASIAISGSAGLGDVLVYTSPTLSSAYAPDLQRWNAGGVVKNADSTTISGYYLIPTSSTAAIFEFPVDAMPRGGYLLVARLASASNTTRYTYTVATKVGSSLVGQRTYTSRTLPNTGGATSYGFFTLGSLTLPATDVPPGSGNLAQITVKDPNNQATRIDELYVCYMDADSALSIVSCGAGTTALGTANSRLWLDPPSVVKPVPAAWLGTAADRTDAYHAGNSTDSWSLHQFMPPTTNVFVATSGVTNAAVTISHFPRWHTSAGS